MRSQQQQKKLNFYWPAEKNGRKRSKNLLENKLHSFLEDNNKRTCSPQKKCSLQFIVITNERKGNKRVFFFTFLLFFAPKKKRKLITSFCNMFLMKIIFNSYNENDTFYWVYYFSKKQKVWVNSSVKHLKFILTN